MALDKDHDRLFNVHWWVGALIQQRQIDITEHSGDRAHQKIDPEGLAPHAPDHALTTWERGWLISRINDVIRDRLLARQEHAPVLDEPLEEHEARELRDRAISYFGAPHDVTRAGFDKLRLDHEGHRETILARHRAIDQKTQPEEHAHLVELLSGHETTLAQIDTYLAATKGLIDRHIATVKTDVAEKRRIAQQHVDDCAKVLEVPYADIVAEYLARVEAELRAWRPEARAT